MSTIQETPDNASVSHAFDPIGFTISRPLATPADLAVGFGQLIDSIGDLTGVSVERIITAVLSTVTISWSSSSIPSEEWIHEVEEQLSGFAACNGVHVRFRRH